MLPDGWQKTPIEDLCESIIDCVNKTAPVVDFETQYKMIRTTNVRHGKVDTENVRHVEKEVYDIWVRRGAPERGDIIFTREAPVGQSGILNSDKTVFLGQRTMMYRVDSNISNNLFLLYSLQTGFCQKQIEDFSNGGTVAHMRVPDCGKILIRTPPLPEQKKIAKILSTWDKAITTTEQLIANSQQQKKALMQQLLTGKKRLTGFSGKWEGLSLGSLGKTFGGLTGKSKEDFGAGKYYIPYMNIFKSGKIDINGFDQVNITEDEKQNSAKYGDIFFTTSSETPHEVGMSSVLLDEVNDVYLNSFCFGFRLHNFELLHPDFAQFLFRGAVVRRKISALAQGATRYNLSKIQMLKIILVLPPIKEQQKIAQVLSSADQEVETLQQKLNFLKEEKKALMQQLLTGKRRVILDD